MTTRNLGSATSELLTTPEREENMITELFRFSDDEIIIKMRYNELRNLCEEIYDLLYQGTPNMDYTYCKQLLEVITHDKQKT